MHQVDRCGFQPLSASPRQLANVLGPAVDAVARTFRIDPESELRNYDTLAEGRQRLADQLFVREPTVGFSRIDHRHAAIDGGLNEPDGPCRSAEA
jgi:hypothetical protein